MTAPETPAWSNGPMTALDLETTGIDPESARIVSAALVSIQAASEPSARTWLVDPGIDIPAEAAAVHGITTDHAVKNGRPPADAVAEIVTQVSQALTAGQPLIVFRAPYALTVLAREAARVLNGVRWPQGNGPSGPTPSNGQATVHPGPGRPLLAGCACARTTSSPPVEHLAEPTQLGGVGPKLPGGDTARHAAAFPTEVAPVIDPAVIDKQINRYRPGRRTLPALCEHYQVRHDGPNQAVEDALAVARLAWRLLRVRPQLAALDLATLHARQQSWAAAQALGLERHLRRTDPTATVNPAWPLLPTTH
ncbi:MULTISPECIES: exonuclease domain-containing protein [unclassified Streptomyces]|uniref:exonuclease domain-containing protein n=1 Tax=unclassified Streptomyces TaxID=2593676 RepID=UPI001F54346B|nr:MULTISPECIES: exonuclease domain-containing protein [unclassified Streptomyces]